MPIDPATLRPATRLVHGGVHRSGFGETAEALFLTSGFVYDSAEQAEEILARAGAGQWALELSELRGAAQKTAQTIRMVISRALACMTDPALAASVLPEDGSSGFDIAEFLACSGSLYMIASHPSEESPLAPLFAAGDPGEAPARARAPALGTGNLLASITSFGIPVLAIWSRSLGSAPEPVRTFRLLVSFVTLAIGVLLVYQWQDVADQQGERLVGTLETSVVERRRLQGHFAEAEKLVSLGHLAAGAAHEINNPVAAMLGYAELLRSDPSASDRVRELGRKIGEQARRIRNLVENLLNLGEQSTLEAQTVDVAALLQSAAELRLMGGRHRNESLRIHVAERPLEVRGGSAAAAERCLHHLVGGQQHARGLDRAGRQHRMFRLHHEAVAGQCCHIQPVEAFGVVRQPQSGHVCLEHHLQIGNQLEVGGIALAEMGRQMLLVAFPLAELEEAVVDAAASQLHQRPQLGHVLRQLVIEERPGLDERLSTREIGLQRLA